MALTRFNLHWAKVNDAIGTALVGRSVGLVFGGNRRQQMRPAVALWCIEATPHLALNQRGSGTVRWARGTEAG